MKPKNWETMQHYKHRNPPWIKLHKSLLDNYEFHCLQDASKALAMYLWLLASESDDGNICPDIVKLAYRLRSDEKKIKKSLDELISKGFFIDDSNMLATCKQYAITETEKSRVEKEAESSSKDDFSLFWNTYPKKTGKADAIKIWKRLKPPITDVLKALKWQIASEQWVKGFIPNPSTYLNQGRWEDEPPINGVKQPKIAWYDTEEATECKAKELGIKRLPDEDLGYYRERIQKTITENNHANS